MLDAQLAHYQEVVNDFTFTIEWGSCFDDAYCYQVA